MVHRSFHKQESFDDVLQVRAIPYHIRYTFSAVQEYKTGYYLYREFSSIFIS